MLLRYDYGAQPKRRVTECDLCGGPEFVTISRTDRYGFEAPADICTRCGLVFLNPVMTAEGYRSFYAEVYRPLLSRYLGRRVDAETIQAEQKDYAAHLASFLEGPLGQAPPATLLDVGGSTGILAAHLAERFGVSPTVLDPAPEELRWARRHGIRTIMGLLEEVDTDGMHFDMITLCQTVDHLLSISKSLERVRDLLRLGGLFFVDIVDLRAGLRAKHDIEAVVKIDHPYYLTEEVMEAYLDKYGLEPIEKDYAPDALHVGYLCRAVEATRGWRPDPTSARSLMREIGAYSDEPKIR